MTHQGSELVHQGDSYYFPSAPEMLIFDLTNQRTAARPRVQLIRNNRIDQAKTKMFVVQAFQLPESRILECPPAQNKYFTQASPAEAVFGDNHDRHPCWTTGGCDDGP